MEMRNNSNNEKRRRKVIQKNAVLVRSVKPGQTSSLVWEKENTSTISLWKNQIIVYMKYKFSPAINVNYNELKQFIEPGEELTKKEILEKCSGIVSLPVLQYIRELEFEMIGKEKKGRLYLR